MNERNYWLECISQAADDCELKMSQDQLVCLAEAVKISHENYGMAFYSPPASERLNEIEREWADKLVKKQKELDRAIDNGEEAVRRAFKLHRNTVVLVQDHGEVFIHGGRTKQIQ